MLTNLGVWETGNRIWEWDTGTGYENGIQLLAVWQRNTESTKAKVVQAQLHPRRGVPLLRTMPDFGIRERGDE